MADVESDDELDEVDLAVVAYLDDGDWEIDDLPDRALDDLDSVVAELGRYDDPGALALIAVGGDFALLVRLDEEEVPRVVLSDITAALEWDLAQSVADHLGVEVDEDAEPTPAGDLALLADAGMSARDLADLLDDEPEPEDLLALVADELGFGEDFEELLSDDDEPDPRGAEDDDEDDEDDPA